jgi:hypothetical protein
MLGSIIVKVISNKCWEFNFESLVSESRSSLIWRRCNSSAPDLPEHVLRETECPVCLEIALPPITMGHRGHIICYLCRKRVSQCCMCWENYLNTRNFSLEGIVSQIVVECRNLGCTVTAKMENLKDHMEGNCEYRYPVKYVPRLRLTMLYYASKVPTFSLVWNG